MLPKNNMLIYLNTTMTRHRVDYFLDYHATYAIHATNKLTLLRAYSRGHFSIKRNKHPLYRALDNFTTPRRVSFVPKAETARRAYITKQRKCNTKLRH